MKAMPFINSLFLSFGGGVSAYFHRKAKHRGGVQWLPHSTVSSIKAQVTSPWSCAWQRSLSADKLKEAGVSYPPRAGACSSL